MSEQLQALHDSVRHLAGVVGELEPGQIEHSAYPSEWSVADVLSHLGSGAVIMRRSLEDVLAGREPDPGFNQTVWDEWNAKAPAAQAADVLDADAALLAALEAVDDDAKARFSFTMGPMTLDFDSFVSLRLNEHVLHTWDVEVALRPETTLAPEAAAAMIDRLEMIARFSGKPAGDERSVTVHTTSPERDLEVVLVPGAVELRPLEAGGAADLDLPAEAFVRLIYGRLDPEHAPAASRPRRRSTTYAGASRGSDCRRARVRGDGRDDASLSGGRAFGVTDRR